MEGYSAFLACQDFDPGPSLCKALPGYPLCKDSAGDATGIPPDDHFEEIAKAVRCYDFNLPRLGKCYAYARGCFRPGGHTFCQRPKWLARMSSVGLDPAINASLVDSLPVEAGLSKSELALKEMLKLSRNVVFIEEDEVYVFGLRLHFVQMIPHEIANRTCSDAPGRQAQVSCRFEGSYQAARPGRKGYQPRFERRFASDAHAL